RVQINVDPRVDTFRKIFSVRAPRGADAAENGSVAGKEVRALLGGYGFARIPRRVERNRREYNFSVRRRWGCSPQKRNGFRPKVGSVGLEFDRFDWPGRIQGIAVGDVNPNDADPVEAFGQWVPDEDMRRKIMVTNSEAFYRF
ncbi:MAG: hypothetical protein VW582_11660, partial [Rhodospirillaceae bacterium]